jgi:hypothetical protein
VKVYKFGGASVKDAESIKNVVRVLKHEGFENTLIIISAMGKMTNAFEKVIHAYFNKSEDLRAQIDVVRNFHTELVEKLFEEKQPTTVPEVRAAVLEAGKKRVRPAMMTAATTIIVLLPVLSSTGKGSDIMIPMAIPTFGGMIIQIMTMFVVPVLQAYWRESVIKKNQ